MKIRYCIVHSLHNRFFLIEDWKRYIQKSVGYSLLSQWLCKQIKDDDVDGGIFLHPSNRAHVAVAIYNNRGEEMKVCGNAYRCVAHFVAEKKAIYKLNLDTSNGIIETYTTIEREGKKEVMVNMGIPQWDPKQIPCSLTTSSEALIQYKLDFGHSNHEVTILSMGNPHVVLFVKDINKVPIHIWGPTLEHHPSFPQKTNVQFVTVQSRNLIQMKIWERGEGIVPACVSGACAAVAASTVCGYTERRVTVQQPIGDIEVLWDKKFNRMYQKGTAKILEENFIWINPKELEGNYRINLSIGTIK